MQTIKNLFHLFQAIIANIIYGFPSKKLICIGITGTDGKTTTTSLIYHILKTAGKKTAMITSIGAYINNNVYDIGFHVTTPSPFGLQKFIRKIADAGNEYLVLEVTSHALDQNRVWGIPFTIGVLTNVTHEHLDYHKTHQNYLATKMKLLQKSKTAVVNRDDESYKYICHPERKSRDLSRMRDVNADKLRDSSTRFAKSDLASLGRNDIISYSLTNQSADYTPQKFSFTTSLLGKFNKQNILAAVATAKQLGISYAKIRQAVKTFKPPIGRQEVVYDKEFRVIIDFAHTPNAFEKILPEVKPKKGRLAHVFGAAGERDSSKRPLMGKVSSRYADIIVLTAEDPRSESVDEINKEIVQGIDKRFLFTQPQDTPGVTGKQGLPRGGGTEKKVFLTIPDRRQAIGYAISLARKSDTVVITGKSHEKSMNYGHGEEPWDEFTTVQQALDSRMKQ